MSHAAAAFILEKSNKMLLMFKALKRKPNANTATTTQSDTSMSSMSQSKQTSAAVNCMDLTLNLTDVDDNLINSAATKLVIQQKNPNDFALLHFLFNDINSLHNVHDQDQLKSSVGTYVNEPITTSNAITQMEMEPVIDKYTNEQSFYEISGDGHQMAHPTSQKSQALNEFVGMPTSITQSSQSKNSVFNQNHSLYERQKLMTHENNKDISDIPSEMANKSDHIDVNVTEKSSLKKRLKFKFKAGFPFFKDNKVRSANEYSLSLKYV